MRSISAYGMHWRYEITNTSFIDIVSGRPIIGLGSLIPFVDDLRDALRAFALLHNDSRRPRDVRVDSAYPIKLDHFASRPKYKRSHKKLLNRAGAGWRDIKPIIATETPPPQGLAKIATWYPPTRWVKFSRDGRTFSCLQTKLRGGPDQFELPVEVRDIGNIRSVPGDALDATVEIVPFSGDPIEVADLLTTRQADAVAQQLRRAHGDILAAIDRHGYLDRRPMTGRQ